MAINCTVYPALQANPDISGIGVICAFTVSAGLTLLCCVGQSVLEHRVSAFNNAERRARWISALRGTIIGFGDQQLATGFSIIIAGYSQLQSGISSYHWELVCNLTWFSTVTHLITLTSLRTEIKSHRVAKWARIVFMGVLNVLLIITIVPTGYLFADSYIPNGFPAWCLYRKDMVWEYYYDPDDAFYPIYHEYNLSYILLAVLILGFGYVTRAWGLIRGENTILHGLFRLPINQPWIYFETRIGQLSTQLEVSHSQSKLRRFDISARLVALRCIYALIITCCEVFNSMIWEFTWLIFAFLWGLIRIYYFHVLGVNDDESDRLNLDTIIAQERQWGFGQVVSVILLALPVTGFFEGYSAIRHSQLALKGLKKPGPTREQASQTVLTGREAKIGEDGLSEGSGAESATRGTISFIDRRISTDMEAAERGRFSLSVVETRPWRKQLMSEPRYWYLFGLWYAMAFAIGVDMLTAYPAGTESVVQLASPIDFRANVLYYVEWIAVDIAILLVASLCFVENIPLSFIKTSSRYKLYGHTVWMILSVLFIGASVGFEVGLYLGYIFHG
ncbi:hypothetical protein GGS26DRAFT_546024 [Hypomontagnella submonticulosa]|nr:hypothetical protein GGS26DRAFT_546024 [Hypomontagnella submonticulosa]